MLRVLYHFKVQAGQEQKFEQMWQEVSETIRLKCAGSRGSVLLRGKEDLSLYIGLTRWESESAWRTMRQSDVPNLEETEQLLAHAKVLTIEAMHEVKNLEA